MFIDNQNKNDTDEDDEVDGDDDTVPLRFPRPTAEQVISYNSSWAQFYLLTLCTKPAIDAALCDIRSADGARLRFEHWTVLKLLLFFSVELLGFLARFVLTLGVALFSELAPAMSGIAVTIFMTHLAWFCVVKRHGDCCGGRCAYAFWALWLGVEPLLLWKVLTWEFGGELKLILYFPNFFMFVACLRLLCAPKSRPKTLGEKVKDTFVGIHNTIKDLASPCNPWTAPTTD